MFPFNSQQKSFAPLPPFLPNPLFAFSMLAQNRPQQQLPTNLNNGAVPPPTTMNGLNDFIQNEFLKSYFTRVEKLAEGVISNPILRSSRNDPESFQKYDQIRKSIPIDNSSKPIGFTQVKKSPTLDSKIKMEDHTTSYLSEPVYHAPKESKTHKQTYKQREPRQHREAKATRTKSTQRSESARREAQKEEKVPEPVVEYNHISEEEANIQLNERYLAKKEYNEESCLIEFTRDFPGWHLDEIFDFMSKAKPYEVIDVIALLKREKEEKLKAAEEKKKEEVEEQTELNKPRIRTRFWKQNENNRKNEEITSARAGRKEKKIEYLIKLKQMLGVEQLNEQKALIILNKAGHNVKKALDEISENIESFKAELSREHL